jgi:hypothetical protein
MKASVTCNSIVPMLILSYLEDSLLDPVVGSTSYMIVMAASFPLNLILTSGAVFCFLTRVCM